MISNQFWKFLFAVSTSSLFWIVVLVVIVKTDVHPSDLILTIVIYSAMGSISMVAGGWLCVLFALSYRLWQKVFPATAPK